MPTIAARHALIAMWPLLYSAKSRPLGEEEQNELRRHCETLLKLAVPVNGFAVEAEGLCLAIHSSGVFENGIAKRADRLLEQIDALQEMLPPQG